MKRMMSRLLVLALALAMVCSSAAIASAEEKDYAGKTFRIAWWGGDARHTMTTEMIAAFEKNYKNLKIEVEYCGFGDYWTKLSTQAAGHDMPDVIQMDYSQIVNFVKSGLLMELNPLVDSGAIDLTHVDASMISGGMLNDKLYGLATGVNCPAMLYNEAIVAQAGVEVPVSMTYTEFALLCKTILEKTGSQAQFTDDVEAREMYFRSLGQTLYAADGKSVGFTKEALVNYWTYILTGIEKGYFMSAQDMEMKGTGDTPADLQNGLFWNAMTTSNQTVSFQGTKTPEELALGVCMRPYADNAAEANPTYVKAAMLWSINADTENAELAADFISFFVNNTVVYDICSTDRGVPISSEIRSYLLPKTSYIDAKVFNFLDYVGTHSTPIDPPYPVGATEINAIYSEAAELISLQAVTKEELPALAEEYIAKMNAVLAGN